MSSLTPLKLRYLISIDEICKEDPLGLATPKRIIEKFGKKGETKKTTAMMIHRLLRRDFLENPVRGGYRLSKKGREAIAPYMA